MIQLRSPTPKKCAFSVKAPFPINIYESSENEEIPCYNGIFNGLNVSIEKREDMEALYTMGYFGKGSLSSSYPAFDSKKRKRQEKMTKINGNNEQCNINYSKKIHTTETNVLQENCDIEKLHLMLEEAFFLAFVLECLAIQHEDKFLNVSELWKEFQMVQPYFVERYVTYHYYRSRGWVVKSGLKYGGDYVLYYQGPPFYHSSAVVLIISNINEYTQNIDCDALKAINRGIELAKKELVIAQVFIPPDFNYSNTNDLSRCTISEFLYKRLILSENS